MNDEFGPDFYDKRLRKQAFAAEYVFMRDRYRGLSPHKIELGTMEEFIDEREYFYQFRVWEERWFREHPDAPGYDVHDFPLYREPVKHIINVGGGPS